MLLFFLVILSATIQPSKAQEPWYWCGDGKAKNFTRGGPQESNLQHVLGELPNATASSKRGFYETVYGKSPNSVNALAMCRGDTTATQCRTCVRDAASYLQNFCPLMPAGRTLFESCFLRWGNDTGMDANMIGITKTGDVFNSTALSAAVTSLFGNLITEAVQNNNLKRYASGKKGIDPIHDVFGFVQCWGNVDNDDCHTCFTNLYDHLIGQNATKVGIKAFTANCITQYDSQKFFADSPAPPPITPPISSPAPSYSVSPTTKSEGKSTNKLALILGSMGGSVLLLLLLGSGYCFVASRKQAVSHTMEAGPQSDYENNNDQDIHFTLEALIAATSNFHDNCKIGEGGFGVVYKGTLSNGKDVAIKKLSLRSSQGKQEFMAEIGFLTRVQHRNLINILGCCVNGFERILVYEYLANRSLDKHIFDLEKKRLLDWKKRMNIILGVAKGLLYLHEDSKLRIIHRDIKASNILLDDSFNAKIADFDLAKLFSEDESFINTRVAGTCGYLSPEYAMNGELSTKADVYSFGILVLEITSGRKINDYVNTEKNLLGQAWRSYTRAEFIKIVDEDLKEEHNYEQILRCNHVGLLCTQADPSLRPLMSEVMMMLSSKSVTLPNPTIPAFISTTTNSTFQNIEISSSDQKTPHVSHSTREISSNDSITTLEPR